MRKAVVTSALLGIVGDSIVQSDGNAALYADDRERHENGGLTAGGPGIGTQPPAPAAAATSPAAPRGGGTPTAAPRGGGAPVRRAAKKR